MNKINYLIFLLTFALIFATMFFVNNVHAQDNNNQKSIIQTIVGNNPEAADKEQVAKSVTRFANILAGAASTIALIFIVIGGIQYITSAGNQEQAQKAKSTLTWAIIGFILIIASYSIVRYFMSFINTGTLPG